MRTEFIYSVAALAAVPVVANADADAFKADAVQTVTTSDVELNVGTLVKGKYILKIDPITITNAAAGDKLTVKLMAGDIEKGSWQVASGSGLNEDFTFDSNFDNVKIVLVHGTKQVTVPAPVITLNYKFDKVAEKLMVEYQKVTTVMGITDYEGKTADINTYSALYDRINAIKNADYAFYRDNTLEELQSLATDQSDVTGLPIYTELGTALTVVKAKVSNKLINGEGGGESLLTRYNALETIYKTPNLNTAKNGYDQAKNQYNTDQTIVNLQALKTAIETFKTELETQEGVKTANEAAKTTIDNELKAVYNNATPTDEASYYAIGKQQINANYVDATDASRYNTIKGEAIAALDALVGTGSNNAKYQAAVDAIDDAYNDLSIRNEAKQNELKGLIAAFKEELTRTVSEYNGYFDTIKGAYAQYDEQKAAADELTAGDDDFMLAEKTAVDHAVEELRTFIAGKATKAGVAELTDDAIAEKITAITTATETYNTKKVAYNVYKSMLDELDSYDNANGHKLKVATNNINNYSKNTKNIPTATYNPVNIWSSVADGILVDIDNAKDAVKANSANPAAYQASEEYQNAVSAINTKVLNYQTDAKAAIDIFAAIYTAHKTASEKYTAVNAIEGIQDLYVWTNQVTINEEAKERTPYQSILGQINTRIGTWNTSMTNAKETTGQAHLTFLQNLLTSNGEDFTTDDILKEEIETLTAIQANHEKDENLFKTQMTYADMDALKMQINAKVTTLRTQIAPYQTKVNNDYYGNVGGTAVQNEINALNAFIDPAEKEAKKDNNNTSVEALTTNYNAVKGLSVEQLAQVATTAYSTYQTFVEKYNALNGETTDGSSAATVIGLKKYYDEKKAAIDALAKLTPAQKTAKKNAVTNAEVAKTEGGQQVKYTLANILSFIEASTQNEQLTDAEVTKYQGIIGELKAKADEVVTQATRLNQLEVTLATINLETAKAAVRAKDPNTNGYYYLQLTGTYTTQYNNLKSAIEGDTNITSSEVTTYTGDITELKNTIDGLPTKAQQNLSNFNTEKTYLNGTKTILENGIAEYEKEEWKSGVQEENLTTLRAYLATDGKIAAQLESITNFYNNGNINGNTSANNGNTVLRNEIQGLLAQYMNPVNYNAQVAADNEAIYQQVLAAEQEAVDAYKKASDDINAYRNLKSQNLKDVLNNKDVKAKYDALIDLLYDFESKMQPIRNKVAEQYGSIVSPAHYDEMGAASIEEYNAVVEDIDTANKDFIATINAAYGTAIQTSIDTYTDAIETSKALVKTYTLGEGEEKTPAQISSLYVNVDNMLEAINGHFDADNLSDNLKALDDALFAAESETTGIVPSVKNIEEIQARNALMPFFNTSNGDEGLGIYTTYGQPIAYFFQNNLLGADWRTYRSYRNTINGGTFANWQDRFETIKAALYELKAKAEANYAQNALVNNTRAAINTVLTQLNNAYTTIYTYAGGADVKTTLDAYKLALDDYPVDGVTTGNAEEWQQAVEPYSALIEAVVTEALYDAEVEAIEGLIQDAKDAHITYVANNDGTTQKAVIEQAVADLATAKAAVAAEEKTKEEALADLLTIEQSLNDVLTVMRTANNGGVNPSIALYDELKGEYDDLKEQNDDALTGFSTTVQSQFSTTDQSAISTALTALETFLDTNKANLLSYEANVRAMIADIEADIQTMIGEATAYQTQLDEQAAQQAIYDLNNTWWYAEYAISTNNDYISTMETEVAAYGSTSKYNNKINQLKSQMAEVEAILTTAKAAAEAEETTADKQIVANKALADVNTAISSYDIQANCNDIKALAKTAYITEKVEAMAAEVAAITWNDKNYTTTDLGKINNKKDGIIDQVGGKKSNGEEKATTDASYYTAAYAMTNAEDVIGTDWYGDPYTIKGVKTTVTEQKAEFDENVAALKAMLKDMSLEEEVKGHITGSDDITVNDVAALTNLIANQQEGSLDLDRGDVNGDGRITVTDVIWLQYFSAFGEWPDGTTNARAFGDVAEGNNSVSLETIAMGDVTRIAVKLDNETAFRAFQIGLQLPAGAEVVAQSFGERVVNGYLMHSENSEGMVRFTTISDIATPFAGNEGAVLYVDVKGLTGSAVLTEAYFGDTMYGEADLTATGNQTTGIAERITNAIDSAAQKVYNLGGRMMDGLKKGINIIRNADGTTTKVVKK